MSSFVPLTAAPASPDQREFRVAVINSDSHATGEGRKTFQSLDVPRPAPHNGEKKSCEPQVMVQRDGDRITHLRIHCSCGQIMDLACVYDAA